MSSIRSLIDIVVVKISALGLRQRHSIGMQDTKKERLSSASKDLILSFLLLLYDTVFHSMSTFVLSAAKRRT